MKVRFARRALARLERIAEAALHDARDSHLRFAAMVSEDAAIDLMVAVMLRAKRGMRRRGVRAKPLGKVGRFGYVDVGGLELLCDTSGRVLSDARGIRIQLLSNWTKLEPGLRQMLWRKPDRRRRR